MRNVNRVGRGTKGWGGASGGEDGIGQGGTLSGCIGGAWKAGDEHPATFAFCALLVLALSLSFCAPCFPLIPGVGLEERFGCWRAVGIGVVAVVVFGFGAAEGVMFE